MTITLELPTETERRLRSEVPNFDSEAKVAVALDLFRKEQITHHELGQLLGLDRFETDAFLIGRNEFAQTLTIEDVANDRQTIKRALGELGR